jgi:hypothetical protein
MLLLLSKIKYEIDEIDEKMTENNVKKEVSETED